MTSSSILTLDPADAIAAAAIAHARTNGYAPLAVTVLDARGVPLAVRADERAGLLRWEIARAKAWGTIAMGVGSRDLQKKAGAAPQFVTALQAMTDGKVVPVPGGVLIRDAQGAAIGSVGVSGDTPDRDEAAALAGIAAAGYAGDTGA